MDKEKTYNGALELFADSSKEEVIEFYVNLFLERNEIIKKYKELEEENEYLKGYNGYLLDRFNEMCKLNNKLNSKLSILLDAFNEIKEDDVPKKNISEEKKQHAKELASPKWKKKREEVFERYGKQCVECGSTKNIQVHHLIYRKGHHLWDYSVDELLPLCKKCHQKVHDDKTHRFHEKYAS